MADFAPGQGVLQRGSIVSKDAVSGQCVLIAAATDTPYGILLDDLDTGATGATDVVSGVVNRKGAFVCGMLKTGAATSPAQLVDALRLVGIFLEGVQAYVG
jgi:hypothetical protein